MGIVRDITVEELKQAVNNIDTSTLAQDSTLQDVVTAISNISGGSDPVTNTTVNTLGKDTTLLSIAAAITGLGTTLGSDKANIDGSNIANPSAFRANINAQEVITPELVTSWTPNTTYIISSQFIKVFKFWKLVVVSFGAEIKVSPVNAIILQNLPTAIRAGGNANYFGTITGANGVSSRMRIDGSNMIVDSNISTQQWYSGLFVYFIA